MEQAVSIVKFYLGGIAGREFGLPYGLQDDGLDFCFHCSIIYIYAKLDRGFCGLT